MKNIPSERITEIITAIVDNSNCYELAVNIPNKGYIQNLPQDSMVEVPALISGLGVRGVGVGNLPQPIASMCGRQITVSELAVEAAVKGDKKIALQALALDPMISNIDVARKILNDYLKAHANYLPQFS